MSTETIEAAAFWIESMLASMEPSTNVDGDHRVYQV